MTDDAPPRRLSITDASYDPSVGFRLQIFLDGIEQDLATGYDLDADTVTRYKADRNGDPLKDRKTGQLIRETKSGEIEVSWKAAAGAGLDRGREEPS